MTAPGVDDQGSRARKIGRAAVLLSMDSFVPIYPYLEVPAPDGQTFKKAIRQAILRNRLKFNDDKARIPDLRSTVERVLAARLGQAIARHFSYWFDHVFAYGTDDFQPYSHWKGLLLRAKNSGDAWDALRLPQCVSDMARTHFVEMIDDKELSELDDRLREKELSAWDVDMFTRHALNEEFADPWITIDGVYRQLRFRRFMGWLLAHLNPAERATFCRAASKLAARFKEVAEGENLPDPTTQALPDAHDLK